MSNQTNSKDDAPLDKLLTLAKQGQVDSPMPKRDLLLKAQIMSALPGAASQKATPADAQKDTQVDNWADRAWQWFAQPLRLATAAALPLMVGFALGNATLITDSELLLVLSEQDSWPVEQMLDESQWSLIDE